MKYIEWFFNLFLSKRAKKEKEKAYIELRNAKVNYDEAKLKKDKYISKYNRKRYKKC